MNPKLRQLSEVKNEAAQRLSRAEIALGNLCSEIRQEIYNVGNEPSDLIALVSGIPDRIKAAQARLDKARKDYLDATEAHEEFAANPEPYHPLEEAKKVGAAYLAGRTQTLCGVKLYANEPVPPDVVDQLDAHRLKTLVDNRYLSAVDDLAKV